MRSINYSFFVADVFRKLVSEDKEKLIFLKFRLFSSGATITMECITIAWIKIT
jgi:hypothetical protein